ncbi:hypothetical protein ACJJTC_014157 [Scirpophaga incertulas]
MSKRKKKEKDKPPDDENTSLFSSSEDDAELRLTIEQDCNKYKPYMVTDYNRRYPEDSASGYEYVVFINSNDDQKPIGTRDMLKTAGIDRCLLTRQALKSSAAGMDITGGLYLKVPSLEGLLQYLLWVFLPEASNEASWCCQDAGEWTTGQRASAIETYYYRLCVLCLPKCVLQVQPDMHDVTVFKIGGPLPIKPKKKKMKV